MLRAFRDRAERHGYENDEAKMAEAEKIKLVSNYIVFFWVYIFSYLFSIHLFFVFLSSKATDCNITNLYFCISSGFAEHD
jgi:hypothetical protein